MIFFDSYDNSETKRRKLGRMGLSGAFSGHTGCGLPVQHFATCIGWSQKKRHPQVFDGWPFFFGCASACKDVDSEWFLSVLEFQNCRMVMSRFCIYIHIIILYTHLSLSLSLSLSLFLFKCRLIYICIKYIYIILYYIILYYILFYSILFYLYLY